LLEELYDFVQNNIEINNFFFLIFITCKRRTYYIKFKIMVSIPTMFSVQALYNKSLLLVSTNIAVRVARTVDVSGP